MNIITIILLSVITFTTRYLFLHPKLPLRIGPRLELFLSFSAPAVLTAIWVPIIFIQNNQLDISLTNPYLLAATLAVVVAKISRSIYLTLGVSVITFTLLKYLFL